MIQPKFKMKDVEAFVKKRLEQLDKRIIDRLSYLGEQCVNNARSFGDNNPTAFPIKYGDFKDPQPLKQRKISERELKKRPHLAAAKIEFGDYIDDTTNLRNSIGYVIYRNGVRVEGNTGSKASSTVLKIANKRAKDTPSGYVLVVVVGMNYAAYVESRGYDVLSSTELWAETELSKLLKQLAKGKV